MNVSDLQGKSQNLVLDGSPECRQRIDCLVGLEKVYNLQGVGQYAADSVQNLDLPPIMGVTLYAAVFIVIFNALVDFTYAWLDPRLRPS